MSKRQVPELSLLSFANGTETEKSQFVDQLFLGLKEYGFIILKDHIIDQKKIDRAYELMHEFFSLPNESKKKYMSEKGGQRGFTPFGIEHAKGHTAVDLKEFFHIGRELPQDHPYNDLYSANVWPTEVREFKETLTELYRCMDTTSKLLLKALGMALEVDDHYFDDLVFEGNSIIRLINYPPMKSIENKDVASVRAQAHADINLITMLVGATDSGLQLLDKDGQWLDVSSRPGEIVVDSGDMLSRITNEVIPATIHRVINPVDSTTTRYSMPFFVHPHPNAQLACIASCKGEGQKYPPVRAHDFLCERLRDIGLM